MNFVYYLLCVITGFVLATADIGLSNWQYWIVVTCIIGAYACGYFYSYRKEAKKRKKYSMEYYEKLL